MMQKNRYEMRYNRLVSELEIIEKKRERKLKQILELRKKLKKNE